MCVFCRSDFYTSYQVVVLMGKYIEIGLKQQKGSEPELNNAPSITKVS